jgi:hypothetical protein
MPGEGSSCRNPGGSSTSQKPEGSSTSKTPDKPLKNSAKRKHEPTDIYLSDGDWKKAFASKVIIVQSEKKENKKGDKKCVDLV